MLTDPFEGLIGASLDIEFDQDRMRDELLTCREFWIAAKPRARGNLAQEGLDGHMPFLSESREQYELKIAQGASAAARRMYLREYDGLADQTFLATKNVDHTSWRWTAAALERCAYTVEVIESLPFKQIGAVACIVFENTFLPTHRDYMPEQGRDRSKSLGLSLVPVTSDIGTQIWHPNHKRVYEVKGCSTLFDDAMYHGVAFAPMRMIVRVFGELDWGRLQNHIVGGSAIYL